MKLFLLPVDAYIVNKQRIPLSERVGRELAAVEKILHDREMVILSDDGVDGERGRGIA